MSFVVRISHTGHECELCGSPEARYSARIPALLVSHYMCRACLEQSVALEPECVRGYRSARAETDRLVLEAHWQDGEQDGEQALRQEGPTGDGGVMRRGEQNEWEEHGRGAHRGFGVDMPFRERTTGGQGAGRRGLGDVVRDGPRGPAHDMNASAGWGHGSSAAFHQRGAIRPENAGNRNGYERLQPSQHLRKRLPEEQQGFRQHVRARHGTMAAGLADARTGSHRRVHEALSDRRPSQSQSRAAETPRVRFADEVEVIGAVNQNPNDFQHNRPSNHVPDGRHHGRGSESSRGKHRQGQDRRHRRHSVGVVPAPVAVGVPVPFIFAVPFHVRGPASQPRGHGRVSSESTGIKFEWW